MDENKMDEVVFEEDEVIETEVEANNKWYIDFCEEEP